ncbi:MAG: SDR family NAD(P)-dependent oxidoreductase, partial [Geopsychrobacter sp.]|nr:SDR family NAD(P)-dependent oxidoreductase [Geopsychrobacter sp.]
MNKTKYVFVTGASSGIGYHSIHALRDRGFSVIASARKDEDIHRLIDKGFVCLKLDLDDSASIDEAVENIKRLSNGRLYGLFNNAAFGQPGAVEDLSRKVLRAQ